MKSWQRVLAESVTSTSELLVRVGLQPAQIDRLDVQPDFPVRVPEPFLDRMQHGVADDPLLRQVLALDYENEVLPGFSQDPLDELHGPMPGLLHKYESRVLLIFRGGCAVNCRYCFRRHFPYQDNTLTARNLDTLTDYLNANPEVNEVILSGGDPLMADDQAINDLFIRLQSISSLRRIRIHTRLPVVIPDRVTEKLCDAIQNAKLPVVVVLHINHAREIDSSLHQAVTRLRRVCRSVLNQSVVLKGVNDSVQALVELSETLFEAGIDPYYLNVLDRVTGTHHFDVSDSEIARISQGLLDRLPGYLVPRLVREVPGVGHKVQWKRDADQ